MLVDDLVLELTESLVRDIFDEPVIINGLIFFTDGALMVFTDDSVLQFGE